MRPTLALRTLLVVASWHALALAEPPPPAPAPKPVPASASSAPSIAIIVASIAAGVAITAYGLSFDCGEDDHSCHRRASLPIFGGVGVAAAGSIVGLVLLPSVDGTRTAAFTLGARFD